MEKKKQIANDLFFASVEEFLREGRSVEMTVKGLSMRPFLRSGRDVVTLVPLGEDVPLERGMVVLFRHRGLHVLHRYVGEREGLCVMEGDGNYRIEELAPREEVVACVSSVRLSEGRTIDYDSVEWRRRTARSLARKRLRTLALDLKFKICK